MAGIYLHIPFCKQACHYCDFHFSTNTGKKAELVEALAKELKLQRDYLAGAAIHTIYFGGGTPSLLTAGEMRLLLDTIAAHYAIATGAEITLEANPDDLTAQRLVDLRQLGVNRLSIGIQSFDVQVLRFLHRAHDGIAAAQCVYAARSAGFDNISIDLIYAIPGQPLRAWQQQVEQGLALTPEHISSYSLTIEPQTAFGKWAAAGKLHPLPDEEAAAQLELLVSMLEANGYAQYEVSNFARPGFMSRHNSSYWRQEAYLGVGPSAHSYDGQSRQFNVANNHLYLASMRANAVPFTREVLSREDRINDYLLTTLRTSWGANLKQLADLHDYNLHTEHKAYIDSLLAGGLAVLDNQVLLLTKRGKLLADRIASDLFIVK